MRMSSIEESVKNFANRMVFSKEALALYAGVATLALSANAQAESGSQSELPPRLEHVNQLPGYDINVSKQAKADLKNSSVIIDENETVVSSTGPSGITTQQLYAWCSGNKEREFGVTFISLAAHCEEDITGVHDGIISPTEFPGSKAGALDFIKATTYKYEIEDPNTNRGSRPDIATSTGIDISTEETDAALLKVSPIQQSVFKNGTYPADYGDLKALPYGQKPSFTPGEEVAMFSSPGPNLNPVKEIGRYIGIYKDYADYVSAGTPTDPLSEYVPKYIVLTDPKSFTKDACYYGASGSAFSAMDTKNNSTTGEHGKVGFSGPLSIRVAINDAGTSEAPDVTKQDELYWIAEVEDQLHVVIPRKDTICEYSVLTPKVKYALAHNFGNYITKYGG